MKTHFSQCKKSIFHNSEKWVYVQCTANNFFKIPQEIHRKRPGNAEFPVEFSEPSNFGIFHASENFTGNIAFPVSR